MTEGNRPVERVMLERLRHLETEIRELRSEIARLQKTHDVTARAIKSHSARLDRLRLDKQIAGLPAWLFAKVRGDVSQPALPATKSSPKNLLVLAPKYPSYETPYGGQPIERRLALYRLRGYNPSVLTPPTTGSSSYERNGVTVYRSPLADVGEFLASTGSTQILVHHPTPEAWDAVKPYVGEVPIHLWIHGFEARDWRDSDFGASEIEVNEKTARLDAINVTRKRALAEAFAEPQVTKIFVSDYMRRVALSFVGQEPTHSHVIPNVVDPNLFTYREKSEADRFKILSVKSFATRTYATDLLADVVEELSDRSFFHSLQFTIRGDGAHFEEDASRLGEYPNVDVQRGVLSGEEISALMQTHGLALLPTRLDTQGMTMCEAMSSGMVVVTNEVAAIPEFIDTQSGLLAPPEDVAAMADLVESVVRDPAFFMRISRGATIRVQSQCGPEATIERELRLVAEAARAQGFDKS